MGIIMTYAVNDPASFHALENWLKQIRAHASERVVKVMVANKIDCPERTVSFDDGKKMADTFGVDYFEVSAKENTNISEMFINVGKQIKEKLSAG